MDKAQVPVFALARQFAKARILTKAAERAIEKQRMSEARGYVAAARDTLQGVYDALYKLA